ncbi:hypothetical protein TorRG33x02_252500 [Trema orientale]|uniref:Uncharacterized protein n=1 Tax=Trema orientale TaxID=63057 RepID=A0A2P5DFT3_TREOI|nr:hypothetical protein TorRG33x02_252500 [Trema orientale]
MLGNRSSYLHNRGFLKRISTNHPPRDLSRNGDEGHAIEQRISEAADQVGGAGAGGGDTDAREARGSGVALSRENPTLLVAREDVADDVGAGERLVNLHGRAAGVGEHVGDALALEGLDEDIGALPGLVGAESRDERIWVGGNGGGGGGGSGGRSGGGRWGAAREGAGDDVEGAAERGGFWGV